MGGAKRESGQWYLCLWYFCYILSGSGKKAGAAKEREQQESGSGKRERERQESGRGKRAGEARAKEKVLERSRWSKM